MFKIIEAAKSKFGQVIEAENNVLLIKCRQSGTYANPSAKYMTIKGGINENGVGFHDGHYDMDLGDAVVSFYSRSGAETSNKDVTESAKPKDKWTDNLVQFPRLISEISAVVNITDQDMDILCDSMDLKRSDVIDLFERARIEWLDIKKNLLDEH
jgi:hypothetical protein